MRFKLFFIGLLFSSFIVTAQIYNPVHWSSASKRVSKSEAVIMIKADVEEPRHIYSTFQPDGGPVKTSFVFSPSMDFELVGGVTEPKPVVKYEKSFDMNVSYFETSVIFIQKIKLKMPKTIVNGSVKFVCCNDKQCLPPETQTFPSLSNKNSK